MARLPIDLDKLISLYESGMKATEVAKQLGCSVNTVLRRLRENDIEIRDSGHYKIGTKASEDTKKKMSIGISKAVHESGRYLKQKVHCENCGKIVEKHLRDIKRNSHNFCSHQCYGIWKKNINGEVHPLYKKIKYNCSQCGVVFLSHPYRGEQTKHLFCSKRCHNDWMYLTQRGKDNPNWNGGKTKWPGRGAGTRDYRELRDEVFERDGHVCVYCGGINELELHHIRPWALFTEYRFDRSNCVTLCKSCHGRADKGKIHIPAPK